jgi:hypothetical protein
VQLQVGVQSAIRVTRRVCCEAIVFSLAGVSRVQATRFPSQVVDESVSFLLDAVLPGEMERSQAQLPLMVSRSSSCPGAVLQCSL